MKISILTYAHAPNCGAVLQAWALKKVLTDMGHDVEVPEIKGYEERGRLYLFRRALKKGLCDLLRECIYQCFTLGVKEWTEWRFRKAIDKIFLPQKMEEMDLCNSDLVVVGSDQVWNPAMGEFKLPLYLGEHLPTAIPIIGYAVSSGDCLPDESWDSRFDQAVRRFSCVTAREQITADFIFRASGVHCETVLDPSLLLTLDDYSAIEEGSIPEEPYVLFYVLTTNDVLPMVPQILRAVGASQVVYVDGCIDFVPHRRPKGYRRFVSPGTFVRLFRNAKAIVACSFHGVAFSVLARKPFVALTTREKARKSRTRAGDLLMRLGCSDRLFSVDEPINEIVDGLLRPFNPKVAERLDTLRQSSIETLKDAVTATARIS